MNLILIGIQGSGKGTQAELLEKKYKLAHISTGELLREEVKRKTQLGKKIEKIMEKGELVPYEISTDLTNNRIKKIEKSKKFKGYILDGFPRNLEQAKALDELVDIDAVIYITLTDAQAKKRITSRVECVKCGSIYSTIKYKKKSCEKCSGTLKRRDDDNSDAVAKRIGIFHKMTKPLILYYTKKKILKKIDGAQSIEKVFKDIQEKLRK